MYNVVTRRVSKSVELQRSSSNDGGSFPQHLGCACIGVVCQIWHMPRISPAGRLLRFRAIVRYGWDQGTLPAMPEASGMDGSHPAHSRITPADIAYIAPNAVYLQMQWTSTQCTLFMIMQKRSDVAMNIQ